MFFFLEVVFFFFFLEIVQMNKENVTRYIPDFHFCYWRKNSWVSALLIVGQYFPLCTLRRAHSQPCRQRMLSLFILVSIRLPFSEWPHLSQNGLQRNMALKLRVTANDLTILRQSHLCTVKAWLWFDCLVMGNIWWSVWICQCSKLNKVAVKHGG